MPRGRKPKNQTEDKKINSAAISEETSAAPEPKKRGRKKAEAPVSAPVLEEIAEVPAPKKRGRKPKTAAEETAPAAVVAEINEKPKKRGRKPASETVKVSKVTRTRKTAEKKAAPKTAEKKKPGRKPKSAESKKAVAAEPVLSPFDRIFHAVADKIGNSTPIAYFAAEVTLKGAVEGKFYVNCTENGMDIAPYDYQGADLLVEVDSDTLESIIAGKTSINDAISLNKLEMRGTASIMFAFAKLIV